MTYEIFKGQNKKARVRVHAFLKKDRIGYPDKANAKRDKFLAHLKNRYGYSNEKAEDELDRLLKQFNRMDRSSGVPRIRSNFKHPLAEWWWHWLKYTKKEIEWKTILYVHIAKKQYQIIWLSKMRQKVKALHSDPSFVIVEKE
jgi:hypothetical protein